MTGIAAASVNNQGVVCVAPQARIIPVKVLDKYGQGDDVGIKAGTADLGPVGTDIFYGAGLVNANKALGGIVAPLPPYTGGDSNENNDDPTHGTTVPINQTINFTGTFNPNADADWYKFDAQIGDVLRVSQTISSTVDGVIELYDRDFGSPIVSGNTGGNGYNEKIENTIMVNKTMYIKVFDDNAGSGAQYTLNITHIRPAKDQWEPNDRTDAAKPVQIGQVYAGTVSPAGDVDYYKFSIPSKGNVTATLTSPQNFNVDVGIYDQSGYNYSFAYYKDNGPGGTDISSVQLKKPGDYYVKVNGIGYNYSEAPYLFKLEFT